jgi:leucyl aminopeptidase
MIKLKTISLNEIKKNEAIFIGITKEKYEIVVKGKDKINLKYTTITAEDLLLIPRFKPEDGNNIVIRRSLKETIVLVGVTENKNDIEYCSRIFADSIIKALDKTGIDSAVVIPPFPFKDTITYSFTESLFLTDYSFKRSTIKPNKRSYDEVRLVLEKPLATEHLKRAIVLAKATHSARDLVNSPPNEIYPEALAKYCVNLAKTTGLQINVKKEKDLQKIKAQGILSVGKASTNKPVLITLSYTPKSKNKKLTKVALVGKGVTFDSGGLCIKDGVSQQTMKLDMAGAAAVIGAMAAIAELKPNVAVTAYIPSAENLIDGEGFRPCDILTMMNGKTVEVLNTDAEGRLILADALVIAERDGADIIIDVATLTGAIAISLGTKIAGAFTDNDELFTSFSSAGKFSGESFWRMPLELRYRDLIKSKVADIRNIGGKWGGSITAALFLREFVAKAKWMHLDIAGTAFTESASPTIPDGGTGFGVRSLVTYIERIN